MARSTFSGPVKSNAGFISEAIATADLPAPSSVLAGTVYVVNDNGAGNNEICVVVSDGTNWKTAIGAALS
jgi:hypothetical protein